MRKGLCPASWEEFHVCADLDMVASLNRFDDLGSYWWIDIFVQTKYFREIM